ncbi:class I SAM-dependent methyltransferase [Streptomyces sp. NPDC059104]|uniref:class I SAM-dependent methyltransferase n=1 Tax=Streptomyces sp. NPDC059104 TaxID=3346729 RepID=UPI00368FA2DA
MCCGTGEPATYLASLGHTVDGVDHADSAIVRAREERRDVEVVEGVRLLRLDIEHDDATHLHGDGHDLITLRLAYPFFSDRSRVLHALGERLREGGALVVIAPTTGHTPAERRGTALDAAAIGSRAEGRQQATRLEVDEFAVLVLRGPCHRGTAAVEKARPTGRALIGALAVVADGAGRVLLGRSTRGMWELPVGRNTGARGLACVAVRELSEERVAMGSGCCFGSLRLYAATTLPGFCRWAAHAEKGSGVTRVATGGDGRRRAATGGDGRRRAEAPR